MKKIRLSIAIFMPMSATRLALPRKLLASTIRSPYSETKRAPDTLKRSVIVDDISAFKSNDLRVYIASCRPIHFVGTMNMGSRIRETRVICQERVSIAMVTKTSVSALLTIPDKVDVNACCAPMTSLLILDIREPVWVRVKNAIDCLCTCSKT